MAKFGGQWRRDSLLLGSLDNDPARRPTLRAVAERSAQIVRRDGIDKVDRTRHLP